jgi:hypothetical protein
MSQFIQITNNQYKQFETKKYSECNFNFEISGSKLRFINRNANSFIIENDLLSIIYIYIL